MHKEQKEKEVGIVGWIAIIAIVTLHIVKLYWEWLWHSHREEK